MHTEPTEKGSQPRPFINPKYTDPDTFRRVSFLLHADEPLKIYDGGFADGYIEGAITVLKALVSVAMLILLATLFLGGNEDA